MEVIFVDLLSKYVKKDSAFTMDSWMCQNLDIDYDCAKLFMKKFPKLTFQNGNDLVVWEWVCYNYFIPLNLS